MKFTINTTPSQLAQVSAFLLSKGIKIDSVKVQSGATWQIVSLTVVAANVIQPEQPAAVAVPLRGIRGSRVPHADVAEMRRLRSQGLTVARIAGTLGYGFSTVARYVSPAALSAR